MKIKDKKRYDRFDKCKGLSLRRDKDYPGCCDDPMAGDRFSYAYYVVGFSSVFVIYDYELDKVRWYQGSTADLDIIKPAKGKSVWDAMIESNRKLFLFDIDWFLND